MSHDAHDDGRMVARRPHLYFWIGPVLLLPALAGATGVLDWEGTGIVYTSVAFSMAVLWLLRWFSRRI